ncbi:hypothetical protein F5Y19DRAFT_285198 [Xylariaceae sp. FL1651]|nr:hypothetical protein F5Y19DRAFT_285198 [Xylariaceae sp. FL1651]
MDEEQPSNSHFFLHIPFSRRWDYHKDTICRLYIDEGRPIEEVVSTMKHEYRFDANVRQYKYHFKKWDISKSIPSAVKDLAISVMGKRVRAGTAVGGIRYKGMEIDKKRLRRYINDDIRLSQDCRLTASIFSRWNLPYQVLNASSAPYIGHISPNQSDWSTPSEISVFSPHSIRNHPSPAAATSPSDALTPTTRAIQVKTHSDRSRFFIQGNIDDFLKDMSASEKRVAISWLHQFWLFAFTTSKHWGVGPKKWTADLLKLEEFSEAKSSPGSPRATRDGKAIGSAATGWSRLDARYPHQEKLPQPSPLCRWCIHVIEPDYSRAPSPSLPDDTDFDIHNEDNWPRWATPPSATVVERLQTALEDNSFSDIAVQDLPLSPMVVATAATSSPKAMSVEALGFAIMSRNFVLVKDLFDASRKEDLDLTYLYPFHLAANYLDGSKLCCNVIDLAMESLVKQNVIRKLYVNDLGHTVLDALMLTIIKSHTSCTPAMVDDRLKTTMRFSGEEVDVCGRWDADSPCLRALNAQGSPRIPFSWKHMFCHTSVQAICHSISNLFDRGHSPDINTPSGLFIKVCLNCGEKLVLGPLHTLVLMAFHLARNGCKGETFFGVIACLVCLLLSGADPTITAELSISELLGIGEQHECTHDRFDPLEFGRQVPMELWAEWTEEVQLGWNCLMALLGFAQRERNRTSQDEIGWPDEECAHYWGQINFYNGSKDLGTLWAAIQAELATYRRLQEGDPWLSANFSMTIVKDGANTNAGFSLLPLIDKDMVKPFCVCGRFV